MAKFHQVGDHLDYAPASETAVGALVQWAGKTGIVDPTNHGGPLAVGELGSLRIRCVVEVNNSGVVFAEGATVGYDATADNAVVAAGGDFDAGVCVNVGGAAATDKVLVLLDG